VEIRQIGEMEDFAEVMSKDHLQRAKDMREQLAKKK
jgi:hypothetical protein